MMFRAARQARIGCMKVAKVLQGYLDGEIDHETAERVGVHLEICRRCGMKADTYRAIKASLARQGEWDDLTRRRIEEFTRRFREGPLTDAER
jgi:anti-sigma factor RsiW